MVKNTTELGYMFGLRHEDIPRERMGSPGRVRPEPPRMAGDLLAIDLVEPGVQPEPYLTGTMLREGLRGNVPTPRDLNSSIR